MVSIDLMDIKEAITKGSCPICYVIEKEESKTYFSLIYEQGPNILKKIDEAGGFCKEHTTGLISYVMDNPDLGGPLSVLDVAVELSKNSVKALENYGRSGKMVEFGECPVCSSRNSKAGIIINTVQQGVTSGSLDHNALAESICFPHLLDLAIGMEDAFPPDIIRRFILKLKALEENLTSYKKSQKYDGGQLAKDGSLWYRALQLFARYRD